MKQIRRGAALLTALALLCAATLPAAAAADTVVIATVRDFEQFSSQCTRDTWSRGITVELIADLDLSSSDLTPVPIFQGTFHGNGHTITGVRFDKKGSRVGLFRTLTQSAVVEDLTVEGTLAPQGSASQVGLLAGENYGTVRRCTARGSVTGQEDIGGLVGLNGESGCIVSCTSAAAVTGVTNVGGVAGENLGMVEDSSNTGEINTQADQETPTSVGASPVCPAVRSGAVPTAGRWATSMWAITWGASRACNRGRSPTVPTPPRSGVVRMWAVSQANLSPAPALHTAYLHPSSSVRAWTASSNSWRGFPARSTTWSTGE